MFVCLQVALLFLPSFLPSLRSASGNSTTLEEPKKTNTISFFLFTFHQHPMSTLPSIDRSGQQTTDRQHNRIDRETHFASSSTLPGLPFCRRCFVADCCCAGAHAPQGHCQLSRTQTTHLRLVWIGLVWFGLGRQKNKNKKQNKTAAQTKMRVQQSQMHKMSFFHPSSAQC